MNDIQLSVVVPAYKEAENLGIILPRLVGVLSKVEPSYEVLVIDTMLPMDNTAHVCSDIPGNILYRNRDCGNNYGDAVRTGIKYARGRYIIFMDGDGSHDPEFIANLYSCRDSNDVVIASRYITGGSTENSRATVFMSLVVNFIYSKVLNLSCKDVSNSFKLYHAADLKLVNLDSSHFDIIEELLFKLKRVNNNIIIKEIPFNFKGRIRGKTKRNLFVFMITYIFTLIRLRLRG
ncbi:MAG: glycosyltransferase [Candidatus Magasanikbacteria bacterium]